jgi:hypothetical protein
MCDLRLDQGAKRSWLAPAGSAANLANASRTLRFLERLVDRLVQAGNDVERVQRMSSSKRRTSSWLTRPAPGRLAGMAA